ncbi:MAG: threonylcarbamoyl-AMP synthase [Candidatus Magasanikbacteria bacterium]|nr:threonylcarbamoyl-AMP synthase [Candidatus Magasanikbacteria bacterium]|tara:strand:+ start:7215 stop:7835 length:621 start_codon:yes stop_codon:yes gene_type:complete
MKTILQKDADIPCIAKELRKGKTIVYPTETCYGLGCDGTNQHAVDTIFRIKKRQTDKPLLVIMADITMAQKYVVWSDVLENIARKFWPGPLTVVADLAHENGLADGVKSKNNTLAFRITDHPLAAALSEQLAAPLVATSANISSMESPYDITHVHAMFDSQRIQPDIVIDAGDLPHKIGSTIVSVQENTLQILRQGEVIIKKTDIF